MTANIKKKIQEKLQTQRNKNNSKEVQKYRKKYGFLYFFRFCKTKKSYNFTIKQLVTCKKHRFQQEEQIN